MLRRRPREEGRPAAAPGGAPSAARSASYLVVGQMAGSAAAFGLGIVLARGLGPGGKGYYDIVSGSASLLMMSLGLSLSSGIFFYASRGEVDHRRLLGVVGVFALALGALAAGGLLAAGDHPWLEWLLPPGELRAAALIVGGLLAVFNVQNLARAVAMGMGRFGAYSLSDVLTRLATLAGALALALAGVRDPAAYVGCLALTTLAGALLLAGVVWRAPPASRALPLKAIAAYSFPLFLGNLVQFLNYRLDIFFVKEYRGLAEVGTYTVAVGIAQLLWLVPNALATQVMRVVARQGGEGAVLEKVAEVNRLTLYFTAACAAGVAGAAALTLAPVFGPEFRASLRPLFLLLPGIVLFTPTIVLSAYLNGVRRQVQTTWVACGSLLATVALNVVLVPRIGMAGAAVASTVSYALSTLTTTWLVLRGAPGLPAAGLFVPRRADAARARRLARAALDRLPGRAG